MLDTHERMSHAMQDARDGTASREAPGLDTRAWGRTGEAGCSDRVKIIGEAGGLFRGRYMEARGSGPQTEKTVCMAPCIWAHAPRTYAGQGGIVAWCMQTADPPRMVA